MKFDPQSLATDLDRIHAEASELDRRLHAAGLNAGDAARRASLGILEQLGHLRLGLDRLAVAAGQDSPFVRRDLSLLPATRREAARAEARAMPWPLTVHERRAQRQRERAAGPPQQEAITGDGDDAASLQKAPDEFTSVPPPQDTKDAHTALDVSFITGPEVASVGAPTQSNPV